MEEHVLSDKPFQFPPALLNQLAVSRWSHWGSEPAIQPEFQVHEVILMWQERILAQTHVAGRAPAASRLGAEGAGRPGRLHDCRIDPAGDEGRFRRNRKPQERRIHAPQAGHQQHAAELAALVLSAAGRHWRWATQPAPKDCQTVAYSELAALQKRIDTLLGNGELKLDTYSRAHLEETSSRIKKVLEARIGLTGP